MQGRAGRREGLVENRGLDSCPNCNFVLNKWFLFFEPQCLYPQKQGVGLEIYRTLQSEDSVILSLLAGPKYNPQVPSTPQYLLEFLTLNSVPCLESLIWLFVCPSSAKLLSPLLIFSENIGSSPCSVLQLLPPAASLSTQGPYFLSL